MYETQNVGIRRNTCFNPPEYWKDNNCIQKDRTYQQSDKETRTERQTSPFAFGIGCGLKVDWTSKAGRREQFGQYSEWVREEDNRMEETADQSFTCRWGSVEGVERSHRSGPEFNRRRDNERKDSQGREQREAPPSAINQGLKIGQKVTPLI